MQHALKPSSPIQNVGGTLTYNGPVWKFLGNEAKNRLIIEAYTAGAESDKHVAAILKASSKSAVGGQIFRERRKNPTVFPEWLLKKREESKRNQKPPGRWKKPNGAQAPARTLPQQPSAMASKLAARTKKQATQPQQPPTKPKPPVKPVGYCTKLVGKDDPEKNKEQEMCGAFTGDPKKKRCPEHE
jgi:hypothetical protein